MLARLPPLEDGRLPLTRPRLSLAQATGSFLRRFPRGFRDPRFLGDRHSGERRYKEVAHQQWDKTLGHGEATRLVRRRATALLVERALAVEGLLNLLSPYEKMALREALGKHPEAARRFFETLVAVLDARTLSRTVWEPYVQAVTSLPAEAGRARVATWPVLTLFPYVAQPTRHMFLKPEVTQHCAEVLAFDLQYSATLNWPTYERLLEMSQILLAHLRPHGARDLIDVQSFIWVIARQAGGQYGAAAPPPADGAKPGA
jgi:hypothetical protein